MAGTSSKPDDLEAVRAIVEALKAFDVEDQRRILRWAQEKLGLAALGVAASAAPLGAAAPMADTPPPAPTPTVTPGTRDIRSFLQEKRPSSDVQFATAVAYYYAFEVPPSLRKTEISTTDLQDAARQAGRARLHEPKDTLNNALKGGYLDRGSGRGTWRINTVGENLVAMAMPGDATGDTALRKPRRGRKPPAKRPKSATRKRAPRP